MISEPAITVTSHVLSDLSGGTGHTLAGLLGVLDQADAVVPPQRSQRRRGVAHRDAYRRGAVRRAPLRPVPQVPAARPAPSGSRPAVAVRPAPAGAAVSIGRLHALTRRAALWGAGPNGEHLAWSAGAPVHRTAERAPERTGRPHRLRGLIRRLAIRGAGLQNEYLAWASSATPGPTVPLHGREPQDTRPDTDRPVAPWTLSSTPTSQPAAPSPVAALLPSGPPSSAGPRGARPAPSGAVPVPGVRPGGRLERSSATGWPPRQTTGSVRLSPAATGLVRARGDPFSCPVRGSPPPARRARSPGSARSSFPPGPAPRPGTAAFRA